MNISYVQDNDSAKYYDAFQKVMSDLLQSTDEVLDPSIHFTDETFDTLVQMVVNYKNDNVSDETEDETAGQAWKPECVDPLTSHHELGETMQLQMSMSREMRGNSPLPTETEASFESVCPLLLAPPHHGQAPGIENEYYGYLKSAMSSILKELNIPPTEHFESYSKIIDNNEDSLKVQLSVKYELLNNPRAVELMDLLGIA